LVTEVDEAGDAIIEIVRVQRERIRGQVRIQVNRIRFRGGGFTAWV
jgi:hypothetical protein